MTVENSKPWGSQDKPWERPLDRAPLATSDWKPGPRPEWVCDYKDMRVVHTYDLYPANGVYVSGSWGWRIFQPDEVFYTELDAWKAMRRVILARKKALSRDWQLIRDRLHAWRELQKRIRTNRKTYNPNRFYVFMDDYRRIETVYTDQISPVKEYIGETRYYSVEIAGNKLGEYRKELFHRTYEEATYDANDWFKQNLDVLKSNIANIDNYLREATPKC